jgi:YesN/AraC family two-component response regulator
MLINISRDITTSRIESQKGNDKPFTIARDILNFLNAEYPNKLSSTNISDKFEGNFDYLNRCFKRLTGHTIFSYLNLIRINKAKEMIMATHMHFNEISYLVGIDNPYYFSRLFKKIVGKTPSQYSSTYNEASH